MVSNRVFNFATRNRCARISDSWICGALAMASARSAPILSASADSSVNASSRCLSAASRKPRPNSALSSNSEFDHAGPAAVRVFGPRRDRQVAAVNRRTAGGVGDLRAIAEQLAEQFQVWRLTAATAGAGELEQRLQELHAADVGEIDAGAIVDRQRFEERDVGALGFQQGQLVGEVDGAWTLASRGLVSGQASTQRPQPVQSST